MINLEDLDRMITDAMRNRNPLKANLYRMVKSKVTNIVTAKGRKDRTVTKEDVMAAIKKEYKEIQEELKFINPTNSAVTKALCAKLSYLDGLLPKVLPVSEAMDMIKEKFREKSERNMGNIMRMIKESGKTFDMKELSAKVKEMLK